MNKWHDTFKGLLGAPLQVLSPGGGRGRSTGRGRRVGLAHYEDLCRLGAVVAAGRARA